MNEAGGEQNQAYGQRYPSKKLHGGLSGEVSVEPNSCVCAH